MSEKKFFDETPQRLQGYADKWLADPKVKKAIHRSLDDLLSGATDDNAADDAKAVRATDERLLKKADEPRRSRQPVRHPLQSLPSP